MENKIPTLQELKERLDNNKNKYSVNDDLLVTIVSLVTIFPNFNTFLIKRGYDDEYELTTIIFGQIIDYIEMRIKKNDTIEVRRILSFLNMIIISKNNDLKNIVYIGFLENLVCYKKILPDIIKLMPDNLKKIFLTDFGEYLD